MPLLHKQAENKRLFRLMNSDYNCVQQKTVFSMSKINRKPYHSAKTQKKSVLTLVRSQPSNKAVRAYDQHSLA